MNNGNELDTPVQQNNTVNSTNQANNNNDINEPIPLNDLEDLIKNVLQPDCSNLVIKSIELIPPEGVNEN